LIEALRIQASWSKAHYCLGRLYYLWKRPADSEREFRLAILAEPTMAEAQFNLGVLLQDQHRRAEARECYEDALRIRSDFVRAHGNLANMLAEDGQTQEAFRHYQLALQAAPNTPELHYNFGLALQANGQLGEAIVHLRKAVALRPGFADAYLALGKALAHDSQYTEAIRVFRRGLEVEPAHMVMGNEMAWIMATAPDPEARFAAQAIQIGERLAELTSHQEPKPLDTLAAAYAEAGRFDEAVATACEAIAQARAHGQTNLAVEIEVRMKNYEVYQPYRVP
jgi:tetratricopeptide (TPR) repeat protein